MTIHAGQTWLQFRINTDLIDSDLSDVATANIRYIDPNGDVNQWTGSVDVVNKWIVFSSFTPTTLIAGRYRFWVKLINSSGNEAAGSYKEIMVENEGYF